MFDILMTMLHNSWRKHGLYNTYFHVKDATFKPPVHMDIHFYVKLQTYAL